MQKIKIVIAIALGFVVLLPACLLHAWTDTTYPSIKPCLWPGEGDTRPNVDLWRWNWLNYWYANTEDGVSGQNAYIWVNDKPGHYSLERYPTTFPKWVPQAVVAYCWSAWRNNADNLKRVNFDPPLNQVWKDVQTQL